MTNLSMHKTNHRRLLLESLEPRTMLDGDGLRVSNDAYLSLSFADDGVEAAGQLSALHAAFNAVAPEAEWKAAILTAFQTWTVHTNADVGVMQDGGQAFGTAGASFRDPRFGDVRIGAIAMDPSIGAVSVPVDGVVGGTWLGDVLFNTQFNYSSVNDIFAIALHEAGNVLGLEDSDDPNSPLHPGPIPTATAPTATDIANLQTLYGARADDAYEATENGHNPDNDSLANATRIPINETVGDQAGPIPSLLYADITGVGDVDFFRLPNIDAYNGPITVQVRSSNISLLAPHVRVYNQGQILVGEAISSSVVGDKLIVTLPTSVAEQDYFIEVKAAAGAGSDVGGYSLAVTFDGLNQLPADVLEQYANGSLRKLSPDQLSKVLEPDDDGLFEDDLHSNDTAENALTIEVDADFAVGGRYEVSGSISDATDADYYAVRSPALPPGQGGFLTIAVRSTTAGGLVPRVSATDDDGQPLPAELVMNGAGQLVLQVSGFDADSDIIVSVQADDPGGLFSTGNYQLTASFHNEAVELTAFAAGTLAPTEFGKTHTFYVAEPQLFHFLLRATGGSPLSAVVATLRNAAGEAVYRISSPVGETHSQQAVLLAPGEYTVDFNTVSLYEPVSTPVDYYLSGAAISDPFAGDPDDPNAHPFACEDPGLAGFFCYPGEFISADPYLWDDFIADQTAPTPPGSLEEIIGILLGDWWSWVWGQSGVNGPVLSRDDRFDVSAQNPSGQLVASLVTEFNVLANDIDPENGAVVAVLLSQPQHGQLQLDPDGSVSYTPEVGFIGTDSFTYTASDFYQNSAPATVRLVVGSGMTGDFDANGVVDRDDYLAWRDAFGSTTELLADGNHNSVVDSGDYTIWRDAFSAPAAAPATLSTVTQPEPVAGEAPATTQALVLSPAALASYSIASSPLASRSGRAPQSSVRVSPQDQRTTQEQVLDLLDSAYSSSTFAEKHGFSSSPVAKDAAFHWLDGAASTPAALGDRAVSWRAVRSNDVSDSLEPRSKS